MGVVLILGAVAAAFCPALNGRAGFVWDDDLYVTQNASLQSAEGLAAIWTWGPMWMWNAKTVNATPQYYPMTFTTLWLESQMWGTGQALGFHITNVILHGMSALLLWAISYRLRLGAGVALAAALLFAVHPVQVESVVWIAERKNTLAMFFMLGAALMYVKWARLDEEEERSREAEGGGRNGAFFRMFEVLFVLALLSKSVTVMLLPALLVVTWYVRGRVKWRDCVQLAPMFVVAFLMGWMTSRIEREVVGASGGDWELSVGERVLVAGRAVVFYAQKLVAPVHLTFIYERWTPDTGSWRWWLMPAGVAAVVGSLALLAKRIGRGALAGVGIFLVMLIPASGFFAFFPMRYSFVADHFQYFASIGLISLIVGAGGWVVRKIVRGEGPRWVAGASVVAPLAVVLGLLTNAQARLYRDEETLLRDTVGKNKQCWMAYGNLAVIARLKGTNDGMEAAESLYKQSLELKPSHVQTYNGLATLYLSMGKNGEAEKMLAEGLARAEEARRRYPKAKETRSNLTMMRNTQGSLWMTQGLNGQALAMMEEAVKDDPENATSWNNLGNAYAMLKRPEEAIEAYRAAINFEPNNAVTFANMGGQQLEKKRFLEATRYLERAVQLKPDFAAAWNNLGTAYQFTERKEKALKAFRLAIDLDRKNPGYYYNLGQAFMKDFREREAAAAFGTALLLNPQFADAAAALAEVRSMSTDVKVRNPEQGVDFARLAVELSEGKNITYLEMLAQALGQAKQFEEAVEVMKQAIILAGAQNYSSGEMQAMEQRFRQYVVMQAEASSRVMRLQEGPATTEPATMPTTEPATMPKWMLIPDEIPQ